MTWPRICYILPHFADTPSRLGGCGGARSQAAVYDILLIKNQFISESSITISLPIKHSTTTGYHHWLRMINMLCCMTYAVTTAVNDTRQSQISSTLNSRYYMLFLIVGSYSLQSTMLQASYSRKWGGFCQYSLQTLSSSLRITWGAVWC